MKAQGEMKAMRITYRKTPVSGMKADAMVIPARLWPSMAATKQTVMPAVNSSASTFMQRAVAVLLFAHSNAMRTMTGKVTSAVVQAARAGIAVCQKMIVICHHQHHAKSNQQSQNGAQR